MLASYWPLWISLFFVALIVALCFTKIELRLYARRRKEDDDVKVKVIALFGLVSFTIKMPRLTINSRGIGFRVKGSDGETTKHELEVKEAITHYDILRVSIEVVKELKSWFIKLLAKVELSNWLWQSHVGTGDAMSSAMSCGLLWSAKGLLIGTISRYVKVMNSPIVGIQPHFQHKVFMTEWSCNVRLKLGSLVVASIYLLFHFAAFRKGLQLFKTLVSRVS